MTSDSQYKLKELMKQKICILGSTGSIGTQALDVISQHPDLYEAYALTANHRWKELAEQARRFNPAAVVITDEAYYESLKQELADMPDVKVYAGSKALEDIVESPSIDMVLTAMVGYSGLASNNPCYQSKEEDMFGKQGDTCCSWRVDSSVGSAVSRAYLACRQ